MEPVLTLRSEPSSCEYLPDRTWSLRYDVFAGLDPADYMERLQNGWRRFGPAVFRPECPDCRMCRSLRIPVATFRPNQSQRRAWKRNVDDIRIDISAPSDAPAKRALWDRFHQQRHEAKGWTIGDDHGLDIFLHNPLPTEEWDYYVGDRLVAVGYVDALPGGLSAIYFFWDPAEKRRSLGTFNVLSLIAAARQRRVPHVYLGYYVEGCGSLEYKSRFRPNEVLTDRGVWTAFIG